MVPIQRSRFVVATAALTMAGFAFFAYSATASHRVRKAVLRDAAKRVVGQMVFSEHRDGVLVSITVSGLSPGFHGFHVHANNDPTNGVGCIGDPAPPTAPFTSADGHFNLGAGTHGSHSGDMPVLLAMANGRAVATFVSDRFKLSDIVNRAVIVHAGSNNFGNIPVGTNPDQYTPNSPAATTATANTGNAGARVVCGVIE
jgi:Cu-Zn family superoxide dismutase